MKITPDLKILKNLGNQNPGNQENPVIELAVAREKFPVYSSYRGESHASGLISSVLRGEPYHIRGLIIQGASLLTSWPQTSLWRETLSKLEFIACIDHTVSRVRSIIGYDFNKDDMHPLDAQQVNGCKLFTLHFDTEITPGILVRDG